MAALWTFLAKLDVVAALSESAARTVEVAKVIPQERVTGNIVYKHFKSASRKNHRRDCTTSDGGYHRCREAHHTGAGAGPNGGTNSGAHPGRNR